MLGCICWICRCFAISIMIAVCCRSIPATAATCNVIGAHKPSEAEDAFLHSDYDRAVVLYRRSFNKSQTTRH